MAIHLHPLKVCDIRRETADCVSVAFEIPAELKTTFQYKQGQNIAIKSHVDDVRRSYSICTSPLDNELRVAIKCVPGGVFSSFANESLRIGDTLEVMPPTGSFYCEVSESNQKHYVFFAAGSGITPVISLIKTILAVEKHSHVTLVYGNKTSSSIIFKEQLEALKDQYLQRLSVIHVFSREKTDAEINYGRIDRQKLSALATLIPFNRVDEFFICGPEDMIFTLKEALAEHGVEVEKIHFELFTTPTKKNTAILDSVPEETADGAALTVKIDGLAYELSLPYNEKSILDAGLDEGIDLPYACKGGVCCSCRAKLLEGEVEMEVNYGLEDEEILDGYILTCQSHPRTPVVVVDFDA